VTYEINLFLCGWRGFLVGTRRAWHAHQRSRLVGFRGTTVVAAPGEQLRGVKKLTTTVEAVLTRGGLVWGFGLGGAPRGVQWGRLYPTWRPGTLSNHFYVRLRKTHLLHRLTRVFTPPPRRGRRRGTRLVLRWGRLRRGGDLPPGVVPGFQKLAPLVGLSTRGVALVVSPGGPTRVPQEGHLRGGWLRRWWGVTPGVEKTRGGKFRPPLGGGWTSDGTAAFTRVVAQGLQRRNTRVVTPRGGKLSPGVQHFGTPGGGIPFSTMASTVSFPFVRGGCFPLGDYSSQRGDLVWGSVDPLGRFRGHPRGGPLEPRLSVSHRGGHPGGPLVGAFLSGGSFKDPMGKVIPWVAQVD